MSVADFHDRFMALLAGMDLEVTIHPSPNEVPDPVPFREDTVHRSYDPDAVSRYGRALNQSARVFTEFRSRYLGKCSPVHLFWGSFDLAVTRFSGRTAPRHPGGFPALPDWITREAYSHEVSSCGFWPGGAESPAAAYYAYAYPVPPGCAERPVRPADAFWSEEMGEWFLPYEAVRGSSDPEATLLEFMQSTYEAAAELGGWDRAALEAPEGFPRTDGSVPAEAG